MRPTPEQQELINQTLRTVFKFKDTYDEAYDHILSSLEALPADVNFTNAFHEIIEHELGGSDGLKAMERKHVNLAIREYVKEYFGNLLKPFLSWLILPLAAGTYSIYWLTSAGLLDKVGLTFLFDFAPLLCMVPVLVYYLRRKKLLNAPLRPYIGYIRQNMLAFSGWMHFFSIFLWETTNIICYHLKYAEVPNPISTLLFLIICLHTFAYCRIHLDQRNFIHVT